MGRAARRWSPGRPSPSRRVAAQGTGWAVSFSLAKSLGLRKPKREAGSGAKNHHQTLSRVYKDQGEAGSNVPPGPDAGFKNAKRNSRSSNGSRTRNGRPANHSPVALTPRQDMQRFWQEKRATLRLHRNNRAKKKVRRVVRFRILFLFSSFSISCSRDRERGIPRKGSFPVKEPGSEPPY